jgi:cadmium resistance transport/sequestration family protein
MSELSTAIPIGLTTFTATNMDDLVILTLIFSQIKTNLHKQIVAGQYLGFTILVIASLSGFLSSTILPEPWIGLLGIVPMMIGFYRLLHQDTTSTEAETETETETKQPVNSWLTHFLSPQIYSMAAVTIANGADNIAVYAPLFASTTWVSLVIILSVFFLLVGVWCYAASQLTRTPAIADVLKRHGNQLVPFVLMILGSFILVDSHTLENRSLAVLTLVICCICMLALSKNIWNLSPAESREG